MAETLSERLSIDRWLRNLEKTFRNMGDRGINHRYQEIVNRAKQDLEWSERFGEAADAIERMQKALEPFAKCVVSGNAIDGWIIDPNEAELNDYLKAAYAIGEHPALSPSEREAT